MSQAQEVENCCNAKQATMSQAQEQAREKCMSSTLHSREEKQKPRAGGRKHHFTLALPEETGDPAGG